MLLKLTAKKSKSFTGDDGDERDYFWYSGLRGEDGITIKFGSKNDYELDQEVEVNLEKTERISELKDGKKKITFMYKEIYI